MALVGIELETLVSESDALTTQPPPILVFILFFYGSICIIDNGASRRRTRNARFRYVDGKQTDFLSFRTLESEFI